MIKMANVYEFQAPQFVDFNSGLDDSDEADKFFDVEEDYSSTKDENKENEEKNTTVGKIQLSASDENGSNVKVLSEVSMKSTVINENVCVKGSEEIKKNTLISPIRTSKENPEENLSQGLKNVSLKTRKRHHFEGIAIKPEIEKQHCMNTRNDEKIKTPKIDLRSRSVIKDCDQSKNRKRKSTFAEEGRAPEKYMAMAEHIFHYQRDTPPRFHSHKRQSMGSNGTLLKKRQTYKPRRTNAFTPKLMTSMRSRPVEAPSQQEREEMELEEMKKHQVKAHPLNEKIFLPPKLPSKVGKPKTAPAPFNLTQVAKKTTQLIEEEPYKFTANPVPRLIFEKPIGIAPKKELPITVPESPAITKPAWAQKPIKMAAISNAYQESNEDLTSFGVPVPQPLGPKRTQVKPFSFEVRDKEIQEKKKKKIKEILEAEKKMREFKAKPVPSFVASKDNTISSIKKSSLNCSKISVKSCTEHEEPPKVFKARSPRVLRQEPFKPVTEHIHSEPLDIQLHTDRRALKRHDFEVKKAEKEEELSYHKKLFEIQQREKEEAEVAKLRKDMVHKAQPMPKFKDVPLNVKVPSNQPLTDPQSPNFTKRVRTTTQCASTLVKK